MDGRFVSIDGYLEEAKPAWAEFIFPLSVLQRQILNELIYEQLVWEMVVYNLFTLQKNKQKLYV